DRRAAEGVDVRARPRRDHEGRRGDRPDRHATDAGRRARSLRHPPAQPGLAAPVGQLADRLVTAPTTRRSPTMDTDELRYDIDLLATGLARRHARRWNLHQREAVVAGDVRLTWQQLSERVDRLASALAGRGIGHGDRVALFMSNRAEFFEIVLALAELGAVAAPQSFRSS